MNAGDLMTPDPVTVAPETSVAQVMDLMRELEIRHVPVVASGALVGMVSDRDLVQFDIGRLLNVEGAEALRHELGTPVVKIMSSDVISVNRETELDDVVELLLEQRIGALPVVRSDGAEVVGIVSYIDVLRALRNLLEQGE
jgi:acetoin utilization protein AcuB